MASERGSAQTLQVQAGTRCLRGVVGRLFRAVLGPAGSLGIARRPKALARELPRKEVIQPHLPVRLPCYDFTPIAGPTFDGSLPCGLGHRLRVLLTFVV